MDRASDAPVVASAGTQAEPRTPASWLLSAGRFQTAAPLPVGSDPRSVPRTEPVHIAPLPSSPALGRYAKGLPAAVILLRRNRTDRPLNEGFLLRRLQAVEVFEGNTTDPMTLSTQIDKLKERFGLSRVVLVGDRGMITSARIRDALKPAGLDWITALRAPQIRALLDTGAFQLSLFDERDLAEITAPEFPGERLVVCKNPLLAEERARKREDLLQATEAALAKLADQIARGTGPKGT